MIQDGQYYAGHQCKRLREVPRPPKVDSRARYLIVPMGPYHIHADIVDPCVLRREADPSTIAAALIIGDTEGGGALIR